MSEIANGNATANHERLIKRSTIIERRLAGNIFSTIAIDKDDHIVGCGCSKLIKFPKTGYISVFSEDLTIMATTNNESGRFICLTPVDYELMPYHVFGLTQRIGGFKIMDYYSDVIARVSYNGHIHVSGNCEAGESQASFWKNIEDVVVFDGGVVGVTKEGNVLLCGDGAETYMEMTKWTNVARIKGIHIGSPGIVRQDFIGLRKDGTLLYCGPDLAFARHIESYKNIVSFDARAEQGKVVSFYAVESDGSLHYHSPSNGMFDTTDIVHFEKNYIAVKFLPSGVHFIMKDGSIKTFPEEYEYPAELKKALYTLTGNNYNIVNEAMHAAASNPLAKQVSEWKLFDDPDEVLRRYEGVESGTFKKGKKCLYCGGEMHGLFVKKCTACGEKSSYNF